ncbi:MAG: arsenate reductase ArsC [Mizugakiibacter sp.]|uniref:arsenate reductase ArsC n=1 Tax=Mizugakiibacter sp. TaxID=1972610 RepID=UPI0031C2CF2A|nr:arsenate reductase ArsC [Xanthomonadaceae bacterium]
MNAKGTHPRHVLFLCTANSARSIMAEALLGVLGRGRFVAYSAGSHPGGRVQPLAAELAVAFGYPAGRLRSKSWDEFAGAAATPMDLIITVCDNAAGERCPVWPGHPAAAHWGVPDPAAVEGDEAQRRQAFHDAWTLLRRRVELLVALPDASLEGPVAAAALRRIAEAAT